MRNDTTPSTGTTTGNRGGHGFDQPLMRLKDMSGYKVSGDDPDVRGWAVKTRDGTTIGTVDTLVIDTRELKARYIEVDLDRSLLERDEARRITLPIGSARLDDNDDVVMLPEHTPADIRQLPASARVLDRDEELRIRSTFDERYTDRGGTEFYSDPRYDQDRFFGNRRRGDANRDYLTRLGEESMSEESRRLSGSDSTRRH